MCFKWIGLRYTISAVSAKETCTDSMTDDTITINYSGQTTSPRYSGHSIELS
jgi:hypothetical protein